MKSARLPLAVSAKAIGSELERLASVVASSKSLALIEHRSVFFYLKQARSSNSGLLAWSR